MLTIALNNYVQNNKDPQVNFNLGWAYELAGQTGAAVGFYLRAADKTDNVTLRYESIVRSALCLEKQKERNDSESGLLRSAITIDPKRPEAYFLLSRLQEKIKMWPESYTTATVALSACDFNLPQLTTDVEYPGYYGLLFQKGVAAWWTGHCEESRKIMVDLQNNYPMNKIFATAVQKNLETIGYPTT